MDDEPGPYADETANPPSPSRARSLLDRVTRDRAWHSLRPELRDSIASFLRSRPTRPLRALAEWRAADRREAKLDPASDGWQDAFAETERAKGLYHDATEAAKEEDD